MLKARRHHAVIGGMVEVLVDATRYIAIMLVLLLLLGSSRKSRSEAKGRQPARWREGLQPGPRGELLTQSLSGRCLGERQRVGLLDARRIDQHEAIARLEACEQRLPLRVVGAPGVIEASRFSMRCSPRGRGDFLDTQNGSRYSSTF